MRQVADAFPNAELESLLEDFADGEPGLAQLSNPDFPVFVRHPAESLKTLCEYFGDNDAPPEEATLLARHQLRVAHALSRVRDGLDPMEALLKGICPAKR